MLKEEKYIYYRFEIMRKPQHPPPSLVGSGTKSKRRASNSMVESTVDVLISGTAGRT